MELRIYGGFRPVDLALFPPSHRFEDTVTFGPFFYYLSPFLDTSKEPFKWDVESGSRKFKGDV